MAATAKTYGACAPEFDGSDEKFELWEIKFKGHLRLQNLMSVITADNTDAPDYDEKNARVFAELVLALDDKSLALIIRDAVDDGRKAMQILQEHYRGSSKPRIISLYTELTTLRKTYSETATEYFLRVEKLANALKKAGEAVSDRLMIAMAIKGLPSDYSVFATVITQKEDDLSYSDFKTGLRSFEETEKSRSTQQQQQEHHFSDARRGGYGKRTPICHGCGQAGHKRYQCSQNNDDKMSC